MGFHDRSTNRQAHPHTVPFCREQRVEYLIDVLRANSRSSVRNRNRNIATVMDRGFQRNNPRPACGGHGIGSVGYEVYDDLLQLDSITCDPGQVSIQLRLDHYLMFRQVLLHQGDGFLDEAVEVERSSAPFLLLEDRPNALNHRTGAMARSDNLIECLLYPVEIG